MSSEIKSNKRCPFGFSAKKTKDVKLRWRLYNKINRFGLRYLRKFWVMQYLGSPYPGIVAHIKGDISKDFTNMTIKNGEPASVFFKRSGIQDYAKSNGGICTFKMGNKLGLYQVENTPLISDDRLSPSTGPNKKLFGDFMGTYPSSNSSRKQKRQPLLKKLASPDSLKNFEPYIRSELHKLFAKNTDVEMSLESFIIDSVSYIDSIIPNVLDLKVKPLNSYISSEKYGKTIREFFELASDVISKLDKKALNLVEAISPFVRELLHDNLASIEDADDSNIIKQYFKMSDIELDVEGISNAPDSLLKELGTIIVAIFDTTSLSLYWLICYIEQNKHVKAAIIDEAKNPNNNDISYIECAILEAIRMAGGNPTALWREVIEPTDIALFNQKIYLPTGTMLWLDRRAANRDPTHFPYPDDFNPENIKQLFLKENTQNISYLIGNNKYEINSFSMVNTHNNPRKCPGRFFSILLQKCFIFELYRNYEIEAYDLSLELRKNCSMPRPDNKAKITLISK